MVQKNNLKILRRSGYFSTIGNSREAWFHETVLSENANAMLLTYLKLMPEINRHAFYDVYTFH